MEDDEKAELAYQKHVGDEGLFPNHSDKDIWLSGYISALKDIRKENWKKLENSGLDKPLESWD